MEKIISLENKLTEIDKLQEQVNEEKKKEIHSKHSPRQNEV